ncbi:hypothetical protein A3J77_01795 [Candidatus Wolfebacteria bacterium RBG_13_41_7]|uniref:Uncharacterized protein n=1 Tax=Candidatus Wolfebacteria bacterium RBG_13_41_7 TaxID=1802554 RepID=A0A1F8DP05_9BACT|nr:MAG: hypothetical protein A3J77_01795 [Candidatus Wolfebacteria bacterium RBG_13_41_7]
MKQTLWKLIVAALLVNFSLTIAGAFISVSNIFTDFFLQNLNGKSISDGLMGVLNPQALIEVEDASAWDILTGMFSYLFKYIASLLFVIVFNFIIILTFFALFIMLLIRAIMLGLLLVIMPIVWLLWIFPGTSQYWNQWWSNFIRWTFFAPIVLFFIVLVISSGGQLQKIRETSGVSQQQGVGVEKAFKGSMTFNPDFFDHVTQIIITTGLLLGGLIAANKMGITFASTAMGLAQGGGKMFGGWVGRKGTQLGTLPFRGAWATKKLEAMEGLGVGKGWAARLAAAPIRHLGARLNRVGAIGAEKAVAAGEKRIAGYDDKRLAKMINTLDAPARVAALQRLKKNKSLDLLPDASAFINRETRDLFLRYGQPAPDYTGMERAVGFNDEMLRVAKAEEEGKVIRRKDSEGKEIQGDEGIITLKKATHDFYKGFRAAHFNTMQVDEFFGKKDGELGLKGDVKKKLNEEAAKAILTSVPEGLGNVYRNIKAVNMDEFHDNNLFKHVKEQANAAGISESKWLKEHHPKAYNFYTSFAAQSLGIGIEPVKEEKETKPRRPAGFNRNE